MRREEHPIPSLSPYVLLCAILAIVIDLGNHHQFDNSDSAVQVLISLQRWTFFFWESNRFGSLLPLLAMPFKNAFLNLMVQSGMGIFGGLFSFFLLSRYLLKSAAWPIVALLSTLAFLILFSPIGQYFYLTGFQPYGVSCSLCLGGFIFLEGAPSQRFRKCRCLGALGLILLAHWENSGISLVMGPLILLRGLLLKGNTSLPFRQTVFVMAVSWRERLLGTIKRALRTETGLGLFLLATATLLALSIMSYWPYMDTKTSLIAPSELAKVWLLIGSSLWSNFRPTCLVSAAAPLGLCFLVMPRLRRKVPGVARLIFVLIFAAAISSIALSSIQWVGMNQGNFGWRYFLLALVFVLEATIIMVVVPIARMWSIRVRNWIQLGVILGLFVAAVGSYGLPSWHSVRAEIDRKFGRSTSDILASRATHICGDYWLVWTSVLHANLTLYEQGQQQTIWGVCYRAEPTHDLWRRTPISQRRVAVLIPPGGSDLDRKYDFQHMCCPEVTIKENWPTLCLHRPGPVFWQWSSGFSTLEGTPERNWRWCDAEGALMITNQTTTSKTLAVTASPRTVYQEKAHLSISGPQFSEVHEVNNDAGLISCTFEVPPGTHEIRFHCDAPRVVTPNDPRELVFQLVNCRIQEVSHQLGQHLRVNHSSNH